MKFTLIRHAETRVDQNVPIPLWGLTEAGIEKTDLLATSQHIKQLDLIYSSCQTKAIETMLYLAKPNALQMQTRQDLTEITSFTSKFYVGQEYEDNLVNYYARTIERIDGGETITEALMRFESTLDAITQAHPAVNNIGIVTHGNILAFFTAKYSDASAIDLHHTIAMPDLAIFDWQTKNFDTLWGAETD